MKRIVVLVFVSLLVGCSAAVPDKIVEVAGNDLQRTSEIAAKYNKPQVQACADFLLGSLKSEDATLAKIKDLLAEKTEGVASAALKAALLAELGRSLDDPAQRAAFEQGFRSACSAVAGDIMLNILRDARRGASKGLIR